MTGRLPSPEDRPGADVVIYDGRCNLCAAGVERLARWDRRGRLAFADLDDEETESRWPQLSRDALLEEMHLVDAGGRVLRGAAALRVIARRLPRLWPLVPVLYFPGSLPLWRWLYRRVARLRYRFGGREACEDGACKLHRP